MDSDGMADNFSEIFQDCWNSVDSYPELSILNGIMEETHPDEFVDWTQIDPDLQQNCVSTSTVIKQEELSVCPSVPANNNWPGNYGFNISFCQQQKTTKSTSWTYSTEMDKFYVTMNTPCPIRFCSNQPPPPGSYIRCMAVYSDPKHTEEVVKRCYQHALSDDTTNKGIKHKHLAHLVRCDHAQTTYHTEEPSKRHYILIPFELPEEGMTYTTYLFKFMCLSSCVGGINRRPVQLIFTLLHNNVAIGRRTIALRICACPGRDRKIDETNFKKQQELPNTQPEKKDTGVMKAPEDPPPKKKQKTGKEVYTIEVHSKKMYDMLMGIKNVLEKAEKKYPSA